MRAETDTSSRIRDEEIAQLTADVKRKRVISYIRSVIAIAALSLAVIPIPFIPLIALFVGGVLFIGEMHLRHSYSKQLENLKAGVADEALITEMISRGSPYVLYLRDFYSETDTTDVLPVDGMLVPVHGPREYSQRNVLEPINKYLPVFAFLNYRSVMWNTIGYRINAVGKDWFSLFERYAASAALIIFDIQRTSDGLLRELDWARKHSDRINIAIFVAKDPHHQSRQLDMYLIPSASWRAGTPLPDELLQHLDSLRYSKKESVD